MYPTVVVLQFQGIRKAAREIIHRKRHVIQCVLRQLERTHHARSLLAVNAEFGLQTDPDDDWRRSHGAV